MSLSINNKRKGSHSHLRLCLVNEINVTPFVDIVLVLLIVFMISAPLLVNGIPLDLPETSADSLVIETEPLTVSVTNDGRIAIKKKYYTRNEFFEYLRAAAVSASAKNYNGFKQRIVIRSSKEANYGQVLDVIAIIQEAGFQNIFLASMQVQR